MDVIWSTIILIMTLCCFLTTLKFSFFGRNYTSKYQFINILTNPYWLIMIIIFIPVELGQFARGEASFIPWEEATREYYRFGIHSASLSFLMISIVDLWLFWTISHVYIESLANEKKVNTIYIRLLNIAIGIILTTQLNPIYKFIGR